MSGQGPKFKGPVLVLGQALATCSQLADESLEDLFLMLNFVAETWRISPMLFDASFLERLLEEQ